MPKRVLVVDDDDDTLLGLKEMLQSADVNVSTADSREQALALLKAAVYDVVIADLMLGTSSPEDGLKLVNDVKTHCKKTRAIVITGCGDADIMERAYAAGADVFYAKPVGARVLKEAIGRMCS
jgi:DNA-binding NtrC family response regulator